MYDDLFLLKRQVIDWKMAISFATTLYNGRRLINNNNNKINKQQTSKNMSGLPPNYNQVFPHYTPTGNSTLNIVYPNNVSVQGNNTLTPTQGWYYPHF